MFYRCSSYLIAFVWFANGLLCKVLGLVPRHETIVSQILGSEHAHLLTILIGLSEIFMGIWILSAIKQRFNAVAQIIIVLSMNTLEFLLVPDLLLWGKANFIFALFFILLVYYREFILRKKMSKQ